MLAGSSRSDAETLRATDHVKAERLRTPDVRNPQVGAPQTSVARREIAVSTRTSAVLNFTCAMHLNIWRNYLHAVQTRILPSGVLEDRDEPMLVDGRPRLND